MPRRDTSSPLKGVATGSDKASALNLRSRRKRKRENCVRFESGEDNSSEEEDEMSEANRELRRQHAEEIEKYIECERNNLTRLLTEFPEDTKLTRRKARELDHDIISILHLGGIQADSSSVLEDFVEDEDDDEEYEPDDDYHSDELSTTCSDIDSQPRTPGEALIQESEIQYDEEGVFKVPGEPPKTPGRPVLDEMIAKRTRSHISLIQTPIETIEENLNLIPPEVTIADIYETETDLDESWQEFLKQFQKPLNTLKEEEDETDPEYIAKGGEARDVEEAEDHPITTEEVQGLLDELLEGIDQNNSHQERGYSHSNAIVQKAPYNPLNVQQSHIQPVALVHTTPSLGPNFQMVLGADSKMYVLPRDSLCDFQPVGKKVELPDDPSPIITIDISRDTNAILQEIIDYRNAYQEHTIKEREGVFAETQLRRLQIQLMKHVQLLGQCFIQSYGHPELWKCSDVILKMLRNLVGHSRKSPTVRTLCWNLGDMHERCLDWQKGFSVDSEENREYVKWHLDNRNSKSFHPRVMEFMVTSKAFVFSELLPRIPINSRKQVLIVPGELHLLLITCKELQHKRPDEAFVKHVYAFIRHYAPWRGFSVLMGKFRRERGGLGCTFRETGEVPEVIAETMDMMSYGEVLEPAQRAKGTLPKNWNDYAFSKERIRRVFSDIVQPNRKNNKPRSSPSKAKPEHPILVPTVQEPVFTIDYSDFKAEFRVPQQIPIQQDTLVQSEPEIALLSLDLPALACNVDQDRRAKLNRKRKARRKILESIERLINNTPKRSKALEGIRRRKRLTRKLNNLLLTFDKEYDQNVATLNDSLISTKIFYYLKEFDIFARLLSRSMKPSAGASKKGAAEEGPSNASAPKRVKLDDEALMAKRTLEMNKKYLKAQRMHENNRLLLQPETSANIKERDALFTWNFFHQVQSTFSTEGRMDKFEEFLNILKNFNPKADPVPDLYFKLEEFFLPDHRELVDMFILFLLPGHAAQVGKFFEHFTMTNMKMLMAKLKIYFEKQPNQMKKILAALNELSAEEGVSMTTIKQRFLPLFKGNPLLIDWFLQLFPTERTPDAQENEFEDLQMKNDLFEEIPAALILADAGPTDAAPPCAIKYMQGRIQYGNRVILPADLSFLATSYELNSVKEKVRSTAQQATKKGKRSGGNKKQQQEDATTPAKPVSCVHAASPAWDLRLEEINEDLASPSSSNNTPAAKEESLCDAATLRAHMHRLNPPVVVTEATASQAAAEEMKISPKKVHEWKTIPIHAKPKSTRSVSPKKNTLGSPPKKGPEAKRKRQSSSASSSKVENKEEEVEDAVVVEEPKEKTPISWTRDEDKLILESINGQQEKTEEEILDQLTEAIPERSRGDINERFQFLINLLKKFE